MSIDGTPLLVTLLAAVPLTALFVAVCWDRGGRARWALRVAGVLTALLSVTGTVLVQVNRITQAFEEATAPVRKTSAGSRILTVTVHGRTRLKMIMYVYLPAAYRTGTQRFPVIEALHGFPATPSAWLKSLNVQDVLDTEIASGRMAPTIVLFPSLTPQRLLDTECTNLKGGPQIETFLTEDVREYARAHWRVRTDRLGWGLTGYSAGGYCASSLLLRHPDRYSAAATMSGLAVPDIKVGDGEENTGHNVVWRLQHMPRPAVALWVGWAKDEKRVGRESKMIVEAARPPVSVTTAVVERGGHSQTVWRQMEPPVFDWLSAHLGGPLP